MVDELGDQVGTLMRSLRTIEQRHSTIRKKLSLTDENLLEGKKSLNKELLALSSDLTDLRHSMETMKYKLSLVQKQLSQTAPKQDLDVLTKYIELWQPMNFVTKNEAKKIVQDIKGRL